MVISDAISPMVVDTFIAIPKPKVSLFRIKVTQTAVINIAGTVVIQCSLLCLSKYADAVHSIMTAVAWLANPN